MVSLLSQISKRANGASCSNYLEPEQKDFMDKEEQFRSPQYYWPRDALHWWSRAWEYPYVYHHLKNWREKFPTGSLLHVIDLGSGVTFFPFSIARLGYSVTCTDIDSVCAVDLPRAAHCLPHAPGEVNFRLIEKARLPFNNDEADVIYCISVLEHINSFEDTIQEIARVLRPGGLLVVTIDLDLRGDSELGVGDHKRLAERLRKHFDYLHQEITVHPLDMLHSNTGPYPYGRPSGLQLLKFMLKQHLVRPLLGRKPGPLQPFYLAVQAYSMTRRP